MELTKITFVYQDNEFNRAQQTVEWPTVPRIGETVELMVDETPKGFTVQSVAYTHDGVARLSLAN